ncbi:hypothetical protein [Streptomyces sp. NPDC056056]|uniref:hypothetical protein n=1 Tax=Streptomyces sp. NPDC056056 TaxID=3345698 RepID=UPI0035DBB0DC
MWVEPWGTDYWMRPGERFSVVTELEPEESPFNVVVHATGITVWVNSANSSEVLDQDGVVVPCGHQRPTDLES